MLLLRLWYYFQGYVIINVNGYFIEKFINLCANKGIYLWDIKRNKHNNMTLRVSINGFKMLKGIAHKTRCNVTIVKKVGAPFIKHRYRKRKSFLIGFIFFLIIIYILSSFIWVVEVSPVKNTNYQEIIDNLAQYNIKPGIFKHRFDKDTIILNTLIKFDTIAWMDIKVTGTKVVVDIVEKLPKPQIIDKSEPCNIYSDNYGVIKQIITRNGTALVKQGDSVKKWQMLICGGMENRQMPQAPRYVHADGTIIATTWYQDSFFIDTEQTKRERTNEISSGYGLKIFSNYYNIFERFNKNSEYDVEEKNIRMSFWKDFLLPIEIVVKKKYKITYNKYTLSEEQAKEVAKNEAIVKVRKIIPQKAQCQNINVEFENINDNKTIKATAIAECIEEIGYKEKITKE